MGKWQSAVFGAIYNKTEEKEGGENDDESLKTEKSGKSKWQESILSAIYGDSAKEAEEAQQLTKEQQAEAKADPVAVAERIFARAESKRNSVLGILGSFAGGGNIESIPSKVRRRNVQTDGRTDRPSCRGPSEHLKMELHLSNS